MAKRSAGRFHQAGAQGNALFGIRLNYETYFTIHNVFAITESSPSEVNDLLILNF